MCCLTNPKPQPTLHGVVGWQIRTLKIPKIDRATQNPKPEKKIVFVGKPHTAALNHAGYVGWKPGSLGGKPLLVGKRDVDQPAQKP